MRYGRIGQTAWNRSIRKQLHTIRDEVILSPSPQNSCGGIRYMAPETDHGLSEEETEETVFLWADVRVSGNSPNIGYYAILQAAGELASRGNRMTGVSVRVLLPPGSEEEDLKELAAGIEEACRRMEIQVSSIQGEVTSAVTICTVFVSGAGAGEKKALPVACPLEGGEILLCGYVGLEGTLRILDEAEDELGTRFVPSFLAQTKELRRELVIPDQLLRATAAQGKIRAIRQIGSGGILAALWDMAEELDTGFEADLSAMTLRQETVEICEFYRLNPYQMTSAGSFLIVTEHGDAVLDVLEKAGARAGRLGVIKAHRARVISSGEEIRYLDRPAPDELEVWMSGRQFGRK